MLHRATHADLLAASFNVRSCRCIHSVNTCFCCSPEVSRGSCLFLCSNVMTGCTASHLCLQMSLGQVIVHFDDAESISGVLVSGSPGVAWFKSDWWHVRLRLMPEVCLDVLTGHTPFSKLAALLPLTTGGPVHGLYVVLMMVYRL